MAKIITIIWSGLKAFGKALKPITWRGWAIILGIIIIAILVWQREIAIKKADRSEDRAIKAEIKLALLTAEVDTVWQIGEYAPPETVWLRSAAKTVYKSDTVLVEGQDFVVKTEIAVDTTVTIGIPDFTVEVGVSGRFYCPEQFGSENWLAVRLMGWEGMDYEAATPRKCPGWSIGVGMMGSLNGGDAGFIGFGFIRNRNLNIYAGYAPSAKSPVLGMGLSLISF